MQPSSRTPEGEPNRCPVCGKTLHIEPSRRPGDAPCPHCGHLLLFGLRTDGGAVPTKLARDLAEELVQRGVLTRWQADNVDAREIPWLPPRSLSHSPPLGQGGMSKVFLAQHETLGHRCADQNIAQPLPGRPRTLLNRLRLEASATARLDHPNIVRAYDFNKDVRYGQEIAFFVMEYIEGRDLRRMVTEDGPLELRQGGRLHQPGGRRAGPRPPGRASSIATSSRRICWSIPAAS